MTADTRFKKQKTSPEQVSGHLTGATKKLRSAQRLVSEDTEAAYQLAYEAMLKASLALILNQGFRPRSQVGHHVAIIEKAGIILGREAQDLLAVFDTMRRNRNAFLYEPTGFISEQETQDALKIARKYLNLVKLNL